jgi:PKD repeat protein
MRVGATSRAVLLILVLLVGVLPLEARPAVAGGGEPMVTIVAPDDGAIVDGIVDVEASVESDVAPDTVIVFYRPHDDATPTLLGPAVFDESSERWVLEWDTRTFPDTHTEIGGVDVQLTKPPTHDELSVVASFGGTEVAAATEVRIQNMLTVRFTLPDNQEDLRGFEDLEALVSGEFEVDNVRFDLFDLADADQRILVPFGEASDQGAPIENPHYGRPLGTPETPTGDPLFAIGPATPEGSKRWVLRGWDTTLVGDGTYALVATAVDVAGRRATYTVETYVVNDLNVVITAPADGANVSRFVALEARTSSLTGADNAAPGGLWPATSVVFSIGGIDIGATELPAGSGRWRAVWDGDSFPPGQHTITATATNANPNGPETAIDAIDVTLVAPGPDLEAFFPFDWSNCTLQVCSFLDGSSGGPTSWEWDFGDGSTSSDQLPTHSYSAPGVYEVTLTVGNGTSTSTYSRVIPVGNVGTVGFNVNPVNDEVTQFIDWTSSFKDFDYTVGETLAVPVMWRSTTGATQLVSVPDIVCDTDDATPNRECVIFTPEDAAGTAPRIVDPPDIGPVVDGVLFEMEFTDVQFRGVTDVFKGKVNLRIQVDTDSGDGDPDLDWNAQLGTNVDVTNTGVEGDETRLVEIVNPFERQFVGGVVPITAAAVSAVTPTQVQFFVDGASIGVDGDGSDGWSTQWDSLATGHLDGEHQLTAVATIAGIATSSAVRTVNLENALPGTEPAEPDGTFLTGRTNDTSNQYITFAHEILENEEEDGQGGRPPPGAPLLPDAAMTAEFQNIVVTAGGGVIGGDLLEFDVVITNTSPGDSGIVLSAFAFQSKFSESPALASRIGDKLFYGQLTEADVPHPDGPLGTVKKNGTSNGLFTGQWKGICVNSSTDFLPEFNSGLEDESLECAGNRSDTDLDGEPELQTGGDMLGLRPGESQVVRLRLDSGTTDGALHVVTPGTIRGAVVGTEVDGPNELTYFVPEIDNTGVVDPNVVAIPDFGDNKVLRDADGTFNPTFAPLADGLTFAEQTFLTLPRPNFAFTDIIGRNHSCATYGLTLGACSGGGSPTIGFLGLGDLVPGVQNFAAILRGFGEFHDANGDFIPDDNPDHPGDTRPSFPYGVLCENCGGTPYVPIAEFYLDNGNGSLTQSVVAGRYGDPVTQPYLATIDAATAGDLKEEVIPEPDPGGPCDPILEPESRRPTCAQLRTSATGHFHSLTVVPGGGINGGDAVEFTVDITNTSRNHQAYLTAFNYQTKRRGLADIGILDGFTQDRRDVRLDPTLSPCSGLDDGACWNAALGIGQFPNVVGNGLLFGQMVWTNDDAGREGPVIPDQVYVDAVNGIDPPPFWLESVKKNGPFTPILRGNTNFICVKSGLFDNDPDADAACAGEPAILVDEDGDLVPANIDQRLGLPPGETQQVRMRMEFGDFRGAMLQVLAGTLDASNVEPDFAATEGLARFFDCSDQRELEYCHPALVGENIGYLPSTDANWMTPETLEEIEYVIINQPGDAPTVMNFQQNLGHIMAMAGFMPSAEFYAPDPNPDLVGTPDAGILIRQQVLGSYVPAPIQEAAPLITTSAATAGVAGSPYSYDVDATGFPGPITYSLDVAPTGMVIDGSTGLISWTPGASGIYDVAVRASNGLAPDAVEAFQVQVSASSLDDFNRADGRLGASWGGITGGYAIAQQQVDVGLGGPIYWTTAFGASQEVAVTMTEIDRRGVHGLFLKGNRDHLRLSAIAVNYDPARQRVQVISQQYGRLPRIVGTFPATMNNGDRFGAQALADGTVNVTVNGMRIGTANAGSFFVNRGGHVGALYLLASRASFDDFGGGTIVPA